MRQYCTLKPAPHLLLMRPIFMRGEFESMKYLLHTLNVLTFDYVCHRTFNHIGTAMYQLFILLTTENYPVSIYLCA